ncbi:hypothetical protein ACIBW9_11530 [Streptomyces sp. NPDC049541]|uniref:hypothetical protein n=1 Tax=Streptomyces sp. NPDC049541 TaxID=3365594 RepID=UPI0037A8557A
MPSSPTLFAPPPRPVAEAVARLGGAAARAPTAPALHWPEGADPVVRTRAADGAHDLTATLAQAVIAFLAGPDRQRLRACHAPRCVRCFLKEHPRQQWCKPAQDRPRNVTAQPTWMCVFIPSCL